MARKNQNELIKCEYCGEMYSVTYKHCPFCNEDGTGTWDEPDTGDGYEETPHRGGGKRLAGGGSRPSVRSIIFGVLSLALIVAAAGIIFSIIHSTLGSRRGQTAEASNPPAQVSSAPSDSPVTGSPAPVESAAPVENSEPVTGSAAPVESQTPSVVTPSVEVIKPTAFTLNREDFTFDAPGQTFDMKVKFTPADATAEVQWKSSDPNVASITWDGKVIAVSKGTVTLTATVEGVGEKTCICRCNFTSSSSGGGTTTVVTTPAPAVSSAPSSGSNLSLNREDFTLSHAGETFRMVVSGTSSAVTWSSTDTSVATIGSDGIVTAVGGGTCRVKATVDGQTLTCIVRCSFSN